MDTDNARLYRAIDASSFRAKMAIGALLAEWAVCRFEGLVDVTDGKLRIEAAWTSVIAPIFVDETTQLHDASREVPVPRAFFEPGFVHTPATSRKALSAFLKGLDPARNPYLRSAKDIKRLGWKGTPYAL